MRVFILAAPLLLVAVASVRAHDLGAECQLKGERVEVEAFFSDNMPARRAQVLVRDHHQHLVAQGRTDERGCWSFPAPAAGVYQVEVDGGDGHVAQVKITVPEKNSPSAALPEGTMRISEGPSRADFTRIPWLAMVLGLGVIAVAGLAVWLVLRLRRPGDSAAG